MSDGRSKDTQRGLGTPPDLLDALKPTPREGLRAAKPEQAAREEPPAGHIRVIARATGTPIVTAASDPAASMGARAAGTAAAAVYVEPKTPPPVRQLRSDTVAVLLSDDIDPQKVPTEPSLSRRREPSAWSDIELLPQVKYRSRDGVWHWVLVALFGGVVGYWVYWGAARGAATPARPQASATASANLRSSPPIPAAPAATGILSSAGSEAAPFAAPPSSASPGERSVSNGQAPSTEISAQPVPPRVEKKAQARSESEAPSKSERAERPAASAKPAQTSDVWLK